MITTAIATRRLAPRTGWRVPEVSEVWRYRELLAFLIGREIKVRYKQTALGAGWAIIQPLMTMVVFTIFFGRLAHMPSDGVPYPVFAMCALVPWTYFSSALGAGVGSVSASHHIIDKVYFPRILLPLTAVISPLVDFGIAFMILVALLCWYGLIPGIAVIFVPVFIALAVLTAAAASIWLSALNVRYRDVRYVVPFVIQLWMFATPIAYPSSLVPEQWRPFYGLNPMAGVIEGFRWALMNGPAPGGLAVVSTLVVLVALAAGATYFDRVQSTFVDTM
jgi:lipopolysaccharide transport system permease protein